jgi:leader peptidase (prepilin peptidase)/N-methyltransferase
LAIGAGGAAAAACALAFRALAFCVGACVGSFMGLCAYRVPRGLSVARPGSACPGCGARLDALSLVPVLGYAARRGRCAFCGCRIPARHPLTELANGALWAAAAWRFGPALPALFFACFLSILTAVALVDAEFMRIPNAFVAWAMAPALASFAWHALVRPLPVYGDARPFAPLLGLIPGSGFFLLVYALGRLAAKGGRQPLGLGDVKLYAPVGLILGLRRCALAVFLAAALGALVGISLILAKKKKRSDALPFGPFIAAGAACALFLP